MKQVFQPRLFEINVKSQDTYSPTGAGSRKMFSCSVSQIFPAFMESNG
jgi:hypothetical protein